MKLRIMEILVVVLAIAGCYCGYRYYSEVWKPEQELDSADAAQSEIIERVRPSIKIPETKPETEMVSVAPEDDESGMNADREMTEDPLAPCEEVNDQTVGWIYIPDTNVDFPIVQGEDNDFYLHNGVDGQYNYELGCPFLDCRCLGDFSGFNSIVYAHHMTKRRMFADIALFKDQAFTQSHPVGYLTLTDGTHVVDFFAYLNVPSSAMVYQTEFYSTEDKSAYLQYIAENAVYTMDMGADSSSHLLLLSTCTYEYDEARGVLVGIVS